MTSRRDFIKNTSMASVFALSIPEIVSSTFKEEKIKKITLQKNEIVLFQGDSITDAGRNKKETGYNNSGALGSGYALMAAAGMLLQHPDKSLKIYNKGISGNKVYQLAERWKDDCIDIKPNVLSILIGVNDFWHTLTNNYQGTKETYKKDFISLLEMTKQELPELKIIIGEPFAVTGVKAVDDKWYPAFDEYRLAAKEISDKFGTVFIPYQSIFEKAQKLAPGEYWTHDGVHPSVAGNKLMAEAWLQTIK